MWTVLFRLFERFGGPARSCVTKNNFQIQILLSLIKPSLAQLPLIVAARAYLAVWALLGRWYAHNFRALHYATYSCRILLVHVCFSRFPFQPPLSTWCNVARLPFPATYLFREAPRMDNATFRPSFFISALRQSDQWWSKSCAMSCVIPRFPETFD